MKVIGHRGAAGLAPENTIPSFRLARELGVDAVECDVRMTRDRHTVLLHDATVDRTTNGKGRLADLTMADVSHLECQDGVHLATLDELLALSGGTLPVVIELKEDAAVEPTVRQVLERDLLASTTFISFELARLVEVRRLAPAAVTGALFMRAGEDEIHTTREVGAQILDTHFGSLSPELVREAHRLALAVWIWTVNETSELRHMQEQEPDGITTDRPDRLISLLGR